MSSNSPYPTFTGSDAHTPVRSNNPPKLQREGHAQPSAEEKREAEQEADLIYEEQIEEEYAKREGGA